jgi:MoaA/NifB/PqqE/SkfB family radical SAM enzyme
MKRLEFHISYSCKNNCIFCSERAQLGKFEGRFVEKEVITERLRKFAQNGFNHVTFTGGEPTLHPHFSELLKLSKELGFKTYVSTNGGMFSSAKFCEKSFPYLDEICFSLHGHNAKLHNFHTRNDQSFSRLLRALKNTEASPKEISGFINIVITKKNFDYLDKIIDFLAGFKKVRQVLISNLAPEGNGLRNFKELAVPLERIQQGIGKIAYLAQRNNIIVRFFGLPLCQLREYEDYSNDLHWSARATLELWKKRKVFLKTTLSYLPVRRRLKCSKCRACLKKDICAGVFKKYYQEFGGREIVPFKQ